MTQKTQSPFALTGPTEILEALVGLKDVRVVHYRRRASDVELCVEQVIEDVRCPRCQHRARFVKLGGHHTSCATTVTDDRTEYSPVRFSRQPSERTRGVPQ